MRGPIEGVDPLVAPLLYSLQHAREDLDKWTAGLTATQIWTSIEGLAPIGFHLRHIAGSTDRLMTYLADCALSQEQLERLRSEDDWARGSSREELLDEIGAVFNKAESVVRGLVPETLREPRGIGRKKLPTTVIGLLHHTAEHLMRHVGEAIVTARLLRAHS